MSNDQFFTPAATSHDYRAFHPPMIRLQQSAPSPQGRRVLWLLLALLVFLLGWALLGRLDIVAIAEGKLVPTGYLKIVQPSEAGIIKEILVKEGQMVSKGQVLMRMDAQLTGADLHAMEQEQSRHQITLRRIEAELGGTPFVVAANDARPLAQEVSGRYRANRAALAAALAEERSRLLKAQQELAATRQQQTRLELVLPHYRNQEKAFEQLAQQGFSGQLMVSDKKRERLEKEQELATQSHLIASAEASITQSQKKLAQIDADYIRQLYVERAETQAQLDRVSKELDKQRHRHELTELRAPQNSVIKDLATHTAGTVVQPGTVLASLVPLEKKPLAEVWVSNEDIGFVKPGQRVKLKFAAYPFQKYGMGEGKVIHVSADAQNEEEARSAGQANSNGMLRYKALLELDSAVLRTEEHRFPVAAGMQTTAEILLGKRSVAQYLLSPVQKAWHEAGRER